MTELQELKAEKKRLVDLHGRGGRKHPSARSIGGLNPAAQRIREINDLIRQQKPSKKPTFKLHALGNWTPRTKLLPKGQWLFSTLPGHYIIARDNLGDFYITQNVMGEAVRDDTNYKTVKQAIKAVKELIEKE